METNTITIDSSNCDIEIFSEHTLTPFEKVVLFLSLSFVFGTLVIAAWSGILVFLGLEDGGGPLGIIMRFFNFKSAHLTFYQQ